MRYGILGETAAWRADGTAVTLRPAPRVLLTMLALDPGRVVPVDRLVSGLYGDAPPAGAGNALQAQVSRLRRQLGPGTVEFDNGGYRLAAGAEDVDAHTFEKLAVEGRRHLAADDPAGAATALREALRLWRGPALRDLDDPGLFSDRVARLDELRLAANEELAAARIALGEASGSIPTLRELVTAHPLREGLWEKLVRALADEGRRAEALLAFEEARNQLVDELGTDPSPELRDLHRSLLRDEPEAHPRTRPLPSLLTSLVGRADHLDRLTGLVRRERLVTLTGVGGVGKSRLGIEAAAVLTDELETCYVELAPVTEPADVPSVVCSALGLRPQGSTAVADQLVNALARRPLLLLLDNCEQLTVPVATLVHTLLGACPGLRVVATSRQSLRVPGETVWPVPPLDHAAIRLFADRATQADPGFTLDEENRREVRRICRALDGIPLGIELAAARVRAVPLGDIADRLDQSLSLVSRDAHAGDPRHRSLRVAIEWSWGLLDDAEQAMARRLSVFTRGATAEAARAVCGLPDTEEVLARLVDKSLVELRKGRYRMLETIRTFAREGLTDEAAWRRRHAEHHLRLAREADPRLRGHDQLRWLGMLDEEYAELRAALKWAAAVDVRLALQLASSLATYWWLRGRRHDAAVLCRSLLDEVGSEPPDDLAEEYLLAVFTAATETTWPDPLVEHLETVNRIVRDWSSPPRQPMTTILWARQAGPAPTSSGPLTPPPAGLLDSDPWSRALHALSDGLQQLYAGRPTEAERSLLTALTRFRTVGERWGTMKALAEAARFESRRGAHGRAVEMLDEAVALAEQLQAREELAEWLRRRARCRVADQPDLARSDAERAVTVATDTGVPELTALARSTLADVARLAGDLDTARAEATRALEGCPLGWARPSEARTEVMVVLGRTAVAEGRLGEATACLLEAASAGDPLAAATALEGLAEIAVANSEPGHAARLLGHASVLRGALLVADPDVDRVWAAVRDLVGAEAIAAALTTARQVARDEALTVALQGWSVDGQ